MLKKYQDRVALMGTVIQLHGVKLLIVYKNVSIIH